MAHMLEFDEAGNAKMAYAVGSEVPWHGLGFQVDPKATPREWMVASDCDWTVEKVPLSGVYNGEILETQAEALVRSTDGKLLSVVTDGWNPVQNQEAFDFFAEYCEAGSMTMETCGSLKGGRHVWALAKTGEAFEILGGDAVEGFFLFSNPHEYGKGIDVRGTNTRVVCRNTIQLALSEDSKHQVRINHRTVFDAEAVRMQLGIAKSKLGKYKELAEFLSSKRYGGNQQVLEFFNRVFPKTTIKEAADTLSYDALGLQARNAFDVLETQPGAEFGRGTFWQLANAATYQIDHLQGRNADNRQSSAWFGKGAGQKLSAFTVANKMALVA